MEWKYDSPGRKSKSESTLNAAAYLLKLGYNRQVIILLWQVARDHIFTWLERNGVDYSSTSNALTKIITSGKTINDTADILILYTLGTMAEWDETFVPTKEQADDFQVRWINLIEVLAK